MSSKPISQRLKDLRQDRGWSREVLSHHAYGIDREGTSVAQITAIERGVRRASARTMLALAKALEVDPEVFPEYRLALARHVLDEERVGLDKALSTLDASRLEPVKVSENDVRRFSHQRRGQSAKRQAAKTSRRTR